jgi:hypothetical protein
VLWQADGVELPIEASLVRVTARVPLAATVRALVRVCELPLAPVAKFHDTKLVVLSQPVCVVVRELLVYPVA